MDSKWTLNNGVLYIKKKSLYIKIALILDKVINDFDCSKDSKRAYKYCMW